MATGTDAVYPSLGMGGETRARYPEACRVWCPCIAPRDAEHTVLHQVIGEHLETFLRATAEASNGHGLP